jgi:hypothetical protein
LARLLIDRIVDKLGGDLSKLDPADCWPFPHQSIPRARLGQRRGRPPCLWHDGKTRFDIRRQLVQHVNEQTLEPYHRVIPCPENTQCVNPYHSRVIPTKRFSPFQYEHKKYLFERELAEFDLTDEELRELFPLNYWEPPT